MNKIVSYSDVKTTPGELGVDDKIVTLSTCTGNESTRYVVQGKKSGYFGCCEEIRQHEADR